MPKRITRRFSAVLLLSFIFVTISIGYFLFNVHAIWQDWKENQTKHSSLLKRDQDVTDKEERKSVDSPAETVRKSEISDKPDELGDEVESLSNGTLKNMDENIDKKDLVAKTSVTKKVNDKVEENKKVNDNVEEYKGTKKSTACSEGKIYFSNELYDCDGLLKDGREVNTEANENIKSTSVIVVEKLSFPTTMKQMTPTLFSETVQEPQHHVTSRVQAKDSSSSRNIFVNCGGTFPWAIQLFLDTYPNSSTYEIFTFLPYKSYKIMYVAFPNHTTLTFEASYENGTQNADIKSFGSGAEITQTLLRIDLATWLKAKTTKEDYVILRIESKEEIRVFKHLVETRAIKYIDKYYTALTANTSSRDLDEFQKIIKQYKLEAGVWDNQSQTYSDFDKLNPKHIPAPGKIITMCKQTTDEEKFALLLLSSSASVNSLKVIDLLHNFSPKNRLQVTIFLPYDMFKSGLLNLDKLFETFHVGMYFNTNILESSNDEKFQYNRIRKELTFVRQTFQKHGKILEYILAGNNISNRLIEKVRENLHYSVITGGIDINSITEKTLSGQTVAIGDTGKGSGDFLVVNVDTPNTEYLLLYMVRRFAPWLLSLSECDITGAENLLNKDVVIL